MAIIWKVDVVFRGEKSAEGSYDIGRGSFLCDKENKVY
jgi:hypothetical protein